MLLLDNTFRREDRVHAFWLAVFIAVFVQDTGVCQDPVSDQQLQSRSAGENHEFGGELKMKFSWCPPGTFNMGSLKSEAGRESDENQVKVVVKNGFWISQTEVTQLQWTSVMRSKPWGGIKGDPDIPDIPATKVSYADAKRFCSKLTRAERRRGTIAEELAFYVPTESQWEYACRAGSETAFCFGDNPEELHKYGRFLESETDNDVFRAKTVAQLRPNEWGIFDMHGNVAEWCADAYEQELLGGVDPFRRPNKRSELQVQRGGHWDCGASRCRSAIRAFDSQDACWELVGFRVVLCGLRHPPEGLPKQSPRRTSESVQRRSD